MRIIEIFKTKYKSQNSLKYGCDWLRIDTPRSTSGEPDKDFISKNCQNSSSGWNGREVHRKREKEMFKIEP